MLVELVIDCLVAGRCRPLSYIAHLGAGWEKNAPGFLSVVYLPPGEPTLRV